MKTSERARKRERGEEGEDLECKGGTCQMGFVALCLNGCNPKLFVRSLHRDLAVLKQTCGQIHSLIFIFRFLL